MTRDMPIHIEYPEGETAPRTAFIMGDPGRVRLLSSLLGEPRVVGQKRGYLIVKGVHEDKEVLLASHGIGGPSLLILVEELRMLGVTRFVRLGTTGAFSGELGIGDVVVASGACMIPGSCGLSLYAEGLTPPLAASPSLASEASRLLSRASVKHVIAPVLCSDAFYAEGPDLFERASRAGCVSVDMETGALYGFAWARRAEAVSILVVSNIIRGSGEELAGQDLLEARFRSIFSALAGLA